MAEGVVVVWSYNCWKWQHGVVRVDVGSVSCGLLDRFHFFFAAGVVEGADHDWLSDGNVSCGG